MNQRDKANHRDMASLHHLNELDELVAAGLQGWVEREPLEEETASAIARIRSLSLEDSIVIGLPSNPGSGSSSRSIGLGSGDMFRSSSSRRSKLLRVMAASLMFILLWTTAQTDLWGQVARDFQKPIAESTAKSPTVDLPSLQPKSPVGPILRFVLLLHVLSLGIAPVGFGAAWCSCNLGLFGGSQGGESRDSAGLFAMKSICGSCILQASGLLLGAVWLWWREGNAWGWSEPERAGLFILGIGLLWFSTFTKGAAKDPFQRAWVGWIGALAFWMIAFNLYFGSSSTKLHTYGYRSPTPDILFGLFALNLLWLAAFYCWEYRSRSRSIED